MAMSKEPLPDDRPGWPILTLFAVATFAVVLVASLTVAAAVTALLS